MSLILILNRYEWNGRPLSISSSSGPSDIMSIVPSCQYCGSQRVYELQLMPALVVLLKIKESPLHSALTETSDTARTTPRVNTSDNEPIRGTKALSEQLESPSHDISRECHGMEFGTVILFSCSNSCWDDRDDSCLLREEFVVVQADPDAELFENKT